MGKWQRKIKLRFIVDFRIIHIKINIQTAISHLKINLCHLFVTIQPQCQKSSFKTSLFNNFLQKFFLSFWKWWIEINVKRRFEYFPHYMWLTLITHLTFVPRLTPLWASPDHVVTLCLVYTLSTTLLACVSIFSIVTFCNRETKGRMISFEA